MAKNNQFKVGQTVSWKSKKQFKTITGTITRIDKLFSGIELVVDCGKDGMWGVWPSLNKVTIIK